MFQLPEEVRNALAALEAAGFEAFLVGGCVRDFLRGTKPADFDITTVALPEQTEEVFRDFRVLETGLRHGTVTVLINGRPLEITTYRRDGSYSDGRHPDTVQFAGDITADLSRRDFTINAMAFRPSSGLLDPFGGQEDLKNKKIRTVGKAEERFSEDALRILRALRFASCLGFSVEEKTAAALRTRKEGLRRIAAERIRAEMEKLLCGNAVREVLSEYPDVLGVPIPEILPAVGFDQHNFHHIYTVWEHTAAVVSAIPPVPALRLAALLHDIGKPATFSPDADGVGHFHGHHRESTRQAERVLDRLRVDNATRDRVLILIRHHDTPLENDPRQIKKMMNKLGPDVFRDLIRLQRADNLGQAPAFRDRQRQLDAVEKTVDELLAAEACFSLKSLAVSGSDLLRLGYRPGPALGKMLNLLLASVMEGTLPNEKEALLKTAAAELTEENGQ